MKGKRDIPEPKAEQKARHGARFLKHYGLADKPKPTEIIIPHISWQNDGVWGAC